MDQVKVTGGARVGWLNASYPLAKLTCDANKLSLSCLGAYQFTPVQVVSITRERFIPVLAWGLRINHNRTDYPEKVVFWTMGNPQGVLDKISKVGFVPSGQPVKRATGIAFRWSFIAAIVVLWNLLMLADFGEPGKASPGEPGPMAVVALGLVSLLATTVKASSRVQSIVLTPGHSVGEVKGFLTFIQLLTGAMAVAFALTVMLGR